MTPGVRNDSESKAYTAVPSLTRRRDPIQMSQFFGAESELSGNTKTWKRCVQRPAFPPAPLSRLVSRSVSRKPALEPSYDPRQPTFCPSDGGTGRVPRLSFECSRGVVCHTLYRKCGGEVLARCCRQTYLESLPDRAGPVPRSVHFLT